MCSVSKAAGDAEHGRRGAWMGTSCDRLSRTENATSFCQSCVGAFFIFFKGVMKKNVKMSGARKPPLTCDFTQHTVKGLKHDTLKSAYLNFLKINGSIALRFPAPHSSAVVHTCRISVGSG